MLSIKSEDGQETVVKEVYVGDVFVCSGQSNMELPITRVREMFPDEPGNAMVHQYKVEECPVFTGALKEHKEAGWNECVGMPLEETTALGYFFGDMIQKKEQVSVGIINISKGGTPVEAWMSEEALADYPEFLEVKERFAQDGYIENLLSAQDKKENAWHELLSKKEAETEDAPWNMGLSGACSQRTGSDAHLYYKTANRNVSGDGCTVYQHDRKRSAVVSGRIQ